MSTITTRIHNVDRAAFYRELGEAVQTIEFDAVWTLRTRDLGTFGMTARIDHDPAGLYAPDVVNDPDGDVEVFGEWEALTGMTGQHGYNGAVMHPSELIGAGIAQTLSWLTVDEPVTFTVTTVADDETDGDPIGWAIVYRTEV